MKVLLDTHVDLWWLLDSPRITGDAAEVIADPSGAHAWSAGRLPPYHRDPFDRMLIAQARHEQLVLVTDDEVFTRHDVAVHGR